MNIKPFIVVFHGCYYSQSDTGLRVYSTDSEYLLSNPSMWRDPQYFDTEEEADQYIRQQESLHSYV